MAATEPADIEAILARVLLPLCVAAGAIVLSGFFFPTFVGDVVTGPAWLTLALVFFVSGLGYIALLPYDTGDRETETETDRPAAMLRIRQTGLSGTVRTFITKQELPTFVLPLGVLAAYILLQLVWPSSTETAVSAAADSMLVATRPMFLFVVLLSVAFCLFVLIGPWGDIKLGGPDTEPAYTYPMYFTLIFTAGIAAGLVFWGPAEALFHYAEPPPYFGVEPQSEAALTPALVYSLFHWGISAWSAYAVIGVPIAYYVFTHDAPLRVSTLLAPVLGVDNLDSAWSTLVDTLAVFAIIAGISTSTALVSEQFLTGIDFQWNVASGTFGPALFVVGLTAIVVISAATGMHRGIRRLATLNIGLFALFALVVAAVGPWGFISRQAPAAVTGYAVEFVPMSVHFGGEWVAAWTVWNWSWWFSWAPFAGLFIAALSKGRRIRTVVFTSVFATSAATLVWFLLLGGSALFVQHSGQQDVLATMAGQNGSEAVAGFPVFAALPLGDLLVFVFLALIIVFMATSADTSTLVVATLATKRTYAPSTGHIVFWGVFQGAVAVSVFMLGGAETLQVLAVLTGAPFAVLAVIAMVGVMRTWYRTERGHRSLLWRVRDRLPAIQMHHDIDPPDDNEP